LAVRKRLLIAESELNRAHAVQECQAMTEGARSFLGRVKSVGSLASAAALLATGVTAFRRSRSAHKAEKSSWLQLFLKGAQAAAPIWLAWRSRQNERAGEQDGKGQSGVSCLHPRD
jgi:hypothetical protein